MQSLKLLPDVAALPHEVAVLCAPLEHELVECGMRVSSPSTKARPTCRGVRFGWVGCGMWMMGCARISADKGKLDVCQDC
eukprot:scaffold49887_cov33-Tisochrysis_lutea.AAC.1